MACKYYGNCKHQSGWCKSESALIRCVYGLNEQCTEQSWKIEALEAENKELKAENQKQEEMLKLLSQTKFNHKIKNPFAFTSGLCCHHCDHKDEYIVELQDENAELKKLLKLAVDQLEEFMNNLCEVADRDSVYSPCTFCLNERCCTDDGYKGVCWVYKNKVLELIGGKNET